MANALITVACYLLLTSSLSNVIAQPSAMTIFTRDSIVQLVLETDMRLLTKEKYKEIYQPATLSVIYAAGDTLTFAIEIRSRGNVRKEVCYFPPIFLKFPKEEFAYHKLKLVNVCRDTDSDEGNLMKEHLVYTMYRTLTDKSLETSLVQITYVDTQERGKDMQRYAFVIQNEDELASAFGGRNSEAKILKPEFINKEQLALFVFFQYMIGNTDWALENAHNVMYFTHPETKSLMPVAYDFDYSGLVNTTYAVPHETIPVDDVTIRYNKGYCIDPSTCEQMRALFLSKESAIKACCTRTELINPRAGKEARQYLEDFFKAMHSSRETLRIFSQDCLEMH